MSKKFTRLLTASALFCAAGVSGALAASPFELGMVIKSTTNPYYNATLAGAKIAAEETGGKVANYGPTESSAKAQVDIINSLAERRVSAIAVAPSDPDAVVPAMERAQKLGVKVVTFDADASGGRPFFVNQATSDSIGRFGAQLLIREMSPDPKGEVAVVSAQPTAANQNLWIEAFKDEIKKYPGVKLVDTVYGYDNEQKAFDATVALTTKYPNLVGIFAPTCPGLPAVARALEFGGQGPWKNKALRQLRAEHHLQIHARRNDRRVLSLGSEQARLRDLLRGDGVGRRQDHRKAGRFVHHRERQMARHVHHRPKRADHHRSAGRVHEGQL